MTVAQEGHQYTVIKGHVYDLTNFIGKHPGGRELVRLAVGRDATILFESYHVRQEIALKMLENYKTDLPVSAISSPKSFDNCLPETSSPLEVFPTPGKSKLYANIVRRVREEVLAKQPVQSGRGHIGVLDGSAPLVSTLVMWVLVLLYPRNLLFCAILGYCLAWVGLGMQHTANHGGWSRNTALNEWVGWLDDVVCGGSSLIWRYHHQISHHVYTNHAGADQDVFSSFPLVRFDESQEWQWYHEFQAIYTPIMFAFVYFSVHYQDIVCLATQRTYGVRLLGASPREYVMAVLGKLVHYSMFLVLPVYLHGLRGLIAYLVAVCAGGFCLALLFAVSHNIKECKEISPKAKEDWAVWQIETSCSWGGKIASFFTGGLNLQIEHHLFPSVSHTLYTRIQPIVRQECEKAGVKYCGFDTLLPNVRSLLQFLDSLGQNPNKKLD